MSAATPSARSPCEPMLLAAPTTFGSRASLAPASTAPVSAFSFGEAVIQARRDEEAQRDAAAPVIAAATSSKSRAATKAERRRLLEGLKMGPQPREPPPSVPADFQRVTAAAVVGTAVPFPLLAAPTRDPEPGIEPVPMAIRYVPRRALGSEASDVEASTVAAQLIAPSARSDGAPDRRKRRKVSAESTISGMNSPSSVGSPESGESGRPDEAVAGAVPASVEVAPDATAPTSASAPQAAETTALARAKANIRSRCTDGCERFAEHLIAIGLESEADFAGISADDIGACCRISAGLCRRSVPRDRLRPRRSRAAHACRSRPTRRRRRRLAPQDPRRPPRQRLRPLIAIVAVQSSRCIDPGNVHAQGARSGNM